VWLALGRGDADEISVEERVRKSVAGVLLTCGDRRRSRNLRIQEIAQTVTESARRNCGLLAKSLA
jgi:hypothetical protein